jgi:hypothetical protein
MRKPQSLRPLVAAFALALVATGASPAFAQSCIDGNVASAQPAGLWGSLQPGVTGVIPPPRDSTDYTGQQPTNYRYPQFSALDVENGWVFMSYSYGMQVWDARGTTNSLDPQLVGSRDGFRCGEWMDWPVPCNSTGEARWIVWDIDAPPGKDNVVAAFGIPPASLSIWNTTTKESPVEKYQDTATYYYAGWVGTINGRDYAFAAGNGTNGIGGISVFDMTTALGLTSPCLENTSVSSACGVRVNRFSGTNAALYIDGFRRTSDGKTFIAHSAGTSVRGVELWNVSSPTAPVNLNASGGRFLSTEFVHGVALWEQGANNFLGMWVFDAANNQYLGRIYNVTSCLSGNCSSLGSPVATLHPGPPVGTSAYYTTFSSDNGTPYLYFGHDGKCLAGLKKEWLYDLSPLATGGQPVEITPPQTITAQTATEGPTPVDYWSYAYANNPGGFSQVMPRVGKFFGGIFYRAAWTLFDTHKRVNVAPQIQVTGATTGYGGAATAFTGTALNCVPATNGWSWSATGGGTGAGTTANASITWATPGNYSVSATNSACVGATGTANVQILTPAPAVSSVTASPSTATVCTPITFTAQNVTGRPPLTLAWRVLQGAVPLPGVSGNTNPFAWTTSTVAAGTYQGEITVSNGFGSPAVAVGSVTLTALPTLPGAGSFAPTVDPFDGAEVQLHVTVPGATEWNWDFGDGQSTGWVSDPNTGPNPTHIYATAGQKSITVSVRNCLVPTPVTSAALVIEITQTEPLVASFGVNGCSFGLCTFSTGQNLSFTDLSSGLTSAVDYFYDWNHTGSDSGTCTFPTFGAATPAANHVYSAAGTFTPCLKLTRGAETSVTVHSPQIIISGATTKSIALSGPATAVQGVLQTYSASAQNCTALAASWVWTVDGGAITGPTDQGTVQVTWSTAGTKALSATNAGCTATTGNRNVSVTAGTGLGATFAYSVAGDASTLDFDGAESAGSIEIYSWTFPGGVVKLGPQVSHTFAGPGTYAVTLEVRGCAPVGCPSATVTKNVVVSAAPN